MSPIQAGKVIVWPPYKIVLITSIHISYRLIENLIFLKLLKTYSDVFYRLQEFSLTKSSRIPFSKYENQNQKYFYLRFFFFFTLENKKQWVKRKLYSEGHKKKVLLIELFDSSKRVITKRLHSSYQIYLFIVAIEVTWKYIYALNNRRQFFPLPLLDNKNFNAES